MSEEKSVEERLAAIEKALKELSEQYKIEAELNRQALTKALYDLRRDLANSRK